MAMEEFEVDYKKRVTNCVFTYYPDEKEGRPDSVEQIWDPKCDKWMIAAREICPKTKRVHWQGFKSRKTGCGMTISAFGKLYKCNMRPMSNRACFDDQLAYIKGPYDKNGKVKEENETFLEWGKKPRQGERVDLMEVAVKIQEEGLKVNDIACDNPMMYHQYGRTLVKIEAIQLKKDTRAFRHIKVIVNWGRTGTGKTRMAYDKGAYKFNATKGKEWWCDYDGEKILLIDEFYGQMPLERMLTLLDGYQCKLDVKCGMTYAKWTTVYISSNVDPEEWYPRQVYEPEKVDALFRRITEINKF